MAKNLIAFNTPYNGCWFRSRLEARWAVFFDTLEVPWAYEAQGYKLPDGSGYLPDFLLPTLSAYLEVKGFWNDSLMRAFRFGSLLEGPSLYVAIGDFPTLQNLCVYGWSSERFGSGVLRGSNGPEWESWFPPTHPLVRQAVAAAKSTRFETPRDTAA